MNLIRTVRLPGITQPLGIQDFADVEATRAAASLAAAGTVAASFTLPPGGVIGQLQPDGTLWPVILMGCEEDDGLGGTTMNVEWTFTIAGRPLILANDNDLTDSAAFRSFAGGVRYGQRRPVPLGQHPEGAEIVLTATNRHATATRRVWCAFSFQIVIPENQQDIVALLGEQVRGLRGGR